MAATDHNDVIAGFSCYGLTSVDLGAPGVAVLSTEPYNSYGSHNGTSMAAPHVSGVAALAWTRSPFLSNLEIKETILEYTDSLPSLTGVTVSGGRLNANSVIKHMICWLKLDTLFAVVQAGASLDVTITLDARDIYGGDYCANVIVSGNDPYDSLVVVPVCMHVDGIPDIVCEDTLDYGVVFIGATVSGTVTISNVGTDLLTVSNVFSDNSDYSPEVTSLTVAPGESEDMAVMFSPSDTGAILGTLTIESDDPDEPSITVALQGVGQEPPVIAVSPDSLYDSLAVGDSSTHHLTICNSGPSDLLFEAFVEFLECDSIEGVSEATFTVTELPYDPTTEDTMSSVNGSIYEPEFGKRIYQSSVQSRLYENILLLEEPCGSQYDYYYDEALSNLELSRTLVTSWGAFQSELTSGAEWDLVIVSSYNRTASTSELDALNAYQAAGGHLIFAYWAVGKYPNHPLLASFGVSFGYDFTTPHDFGAVDSLHPVFTNPNGVSSFFWTDDGCVIDGQIVDVLTGANQLAHFGGFSSSGAVVLNAEENCIFNAFQATNFDGDDDSDGKKDIIELIENEVMLLSGALRWLTLDTTSDTVNSGLCVDIEVTFDATLIYGGDYCANIVILNNDPHDSEVIVPVHLLVTGIPDIAVTPDTLDYGGVFVGGSASDTVAILNTGTGPLTVTEVVSEYSDFEPEVTSFTVQPKRCYKFPVAFTPTTAGAVMGSLVIHSDDPDEPPARVMLRGQGLLPPVICVDPDSLEDTLFTDEFSTRFLTISNTGASDLVVHISADEGAPFAVSIDVIGGEPPAAGEVLVIGSPVYLKELGGKGLSGMLTASVNCDEPIDEGASYISGSTAESTERFPSEEVFGGPDRIYMGSWRTRGNLFACSTSTVLIEHRLYLNPFTSTQLWFVVYEGDSPTGAYNLVSASDVTPAVPGEGWCSSGDIFLPLNAGKHYLIAASFEMECNYFLQYDISPYPIPASFGHLTAGVGWDWAAPTSFPPSPTLSVPGSVYGGPVAYYQTLVTGQGVSWLDLDPHIGTIEPDSSMVVAVHFCATDLHAGEHRANITISSNDPIDPLVTVPVTMTIIDSVRVVAQIDPDTMHTFYANALESVTACMYLGEITHGYCVKDVDSASVRINQTIVPDSAGALEPHPDFVGDVMKVVFPIGDFVAEYGTHSDTSVQSFEVSGAFTDGVPFTGDGHFVLIGHVRGDANCSGCVDIDDVLYLITFVFESGPAPMPIEAGDADCSGGVDIEDVVFLINYILTGGYAPGDPDGDSVPDC